MLTQQIAESCFEARLYSSFDRPLHEEMLLHRVEIQSR